MGLLDGYVNFLDNIWFDWIFFIYMCIVVVFLGKVYFGVWEFCLLYFFVFIMKYNLFFNFWGVGILW